MPKWKNQKVRKIEKSTYRIESHVVQKSFACYRDKANNNIKINISVFFNIFVSTCDFA